MDLPTCPACKQSVLDDDAENCPFCGAPMDGSGPAPQSKAPEASAAAAAKSGGKAESKDDPFGEEATKPKVKVIALSPRPTQSRTVEIVCPMCETKGFAPPQASRREVRCANKECMVPVFKAPDFADLLQPEEEEKPEGGISPITYILVGLALAVGAGFLVWGFVLSKPAPRPEPKPYDSDALRDFNASIEADKNKQQETDNTPTIDTPAGPTIAEQISSTTVGVGRFLNEYKNPEALTNAARLMAEIGVAAGDETIVSNAFILLDQNREQYGALRVPALVARAHQALDAGDGATAGKLASEAQADLEDRRETVSGFIAVADLAGLYARMGQNNEARALLSGLPDASQPELRAALHLTLAEALFQYDLTQVPARRPLLSEYGRLAEVIAVESGTPAALPLESTDMTPAVKGSMVGGWAQNAIASGAAPASEVITSMKTATNELTDAGRALAYARTAQEIARDDLAVAKSLANEAADLTRSLPQGTALSMPDSIRGILELSAKPLDERKDNALALAESADAVALAGDAAAAKALLQAAVDQVASGAPPLADVQSRWQTLEENGFLVEGELQREFDNLTTELQISRKKNEYRGQLRSLLDAAQERHALRIRLLRAVADRPALAQVGWEVAQATGASEEVAAAYAAGSGPQAVRDAARAAVPESVDASERLRLQLADAIASADANALRNALSGAANLPNDERFLLTMHAASALVAAGEDEAAYRFVLALERESWKEAAVDWVAAQAVLAGRVDALQKLVRRRGLPKSLEIPYRHGVVIGLSRLPAPETPAPKDSSASE